MGRRPTARAEVVVDRSPERVFDYLADVSRHGEWSPQNFRVEDLPADRVLEVGSTFTSYGRLPGDGNHRNDVVVVEIDPPVRLVLDATDASGTYRNTFTVVPRGGGSLVRRDIELPASGGLLNFTMPFFAEVVLSRDVAKGLRKLAALLHAKARA